MLREITTTKVNGYFITATWGPRAETPSELSTRFFRMIEAFKQIDPVFGQWLYGRRSSLESHRGNFAKEIEETVERDDFGEIERNSGYWFGVRSPDGPALNRRFSINCHVGKSYGNEYANEVIVKESTSVQPAPEMHSRRIFYPALLAVVEAWDPVTVEANCGWLVQRKSYDAHFRPAWMRYLCPGLAQKAKPPKSAIIEYLPNGGVLLSATEQTLDVDNPNHVAAAEKIAAALAGLNGGLVG
jgi:hypothetical protein